MKEKILPFIIGVLVGGIIVTIGFLAYSKSVCNNANSNPLNPGGQMGQPPEKPNGDNGSEPPTKPENSNN